MTNELLLTTKDWMNIFIILGKANTMVSSKPAFYERFINASLKYNYLPPELKNKVLKFHEENKSKTYKEISEKWSNTFSNDFNINDNFNLFLLTSNYREEKVLVEFIEKKIGKKDTFYILNRFFLDDNNASNFYILRKKWRELLEKHNYPINTNIVKRIVDDSTTNVVHKYSRTTEVFINFKMLVLGHIYNPDEKKLENYILEHSSDALFEKKAFEYLYKKNISLSLTPEWTTKIPFIKHEELIYKLRLDPEFLLKKHDLSRKNSELICNGFIEYINKTINQPSYINKTINEPSYINNTFTIQVKCNDISQYEVFKNIINQKIFFLDEAVDYIKNSKYTDASEIASFFIENIDKLVIKDNLEKKLNNKPYQKKPKI